MGDHTRVVLWLPLEEAPPGGCCDREELLRAAGNSQHTSRESTVLGAKEGTNGWLGVQQKLCISAEEG